MTLDVVSEAFHGGVTFRRMLLQRAKDNRVQVTSQATLACWVFNHGTGRVRLLFAKDREQFFERRMAMRKPMRFASRKDFVEQDAERIDIRRFSNGLASCLLG